MSCVSQNKNIIIHRWPGASLIVIRGHKHLHECAYIGDDSSEEIEEAMEAIRENGVPAPSQEDEEQDEEEDAPPNTPGKMTRRRPWVELHPAREGHDNHTLEEEPLVEDHNTDPKVIIKDFCIVFKQNI